METTQSRELKYYSRQSVANLYNVAAEAYYELESYESAATMYQKAIGYSPDILSYYQGEVTALIQLGDYSGADEVLAEMAKAVPDAEQSGAYQVVQSELLRKQETCRMRWMPPVRQSARRTATTSLHARTVWQHRSVRISETPCFRRKSIS